MMKHALILLGLFCQITAYAWGPTGHRTVGQIAENHLSEKAKAAIAHLLPGQSLAVVSTWMDEIRSDTAYDHMKVWHYVSIPDGQTYESVKSEVDVIAQIKAHMDLLLKGDASAEAQATAVKVLVHLIGDIHQPLHVGRKADRGGNSIKVTWFDEPSNLHRVWDSEMIDFYRMSYTELAASLDQVAEEQVTTWQKASVIDWANESMAARPGIYENLGECQTEEHEGAHAPSLTCTYAYSYRYHYVHFDVVRQRLFQAGIRLAGVLNAIFE